MCQDEMGMTVREIGEKYKTDYTWVSYQIQLLTLPTQIKDLLTQVNKITVRHGIEISKLCKPEELEKFFEANKDYITSFLSGSPETNSIHSDLVYT